MSAVALSPMEASGRPSHRPLRHRVHHRWRPRPIVRADAEERQSGPEGLTPAAIGQPEESDDRPGLILVLGEPQVAARSSEYQVELAFPDGEKLLIQKEVERDAAGRLSAILVACKLSPPETLATD